MCTIMIGSYKVVDYRHNLHRTLYQLGTKGLSEVQMTLEKVLS